MTHIPRLFCFCGGEMKNEKMGVTLEVSTRHEPYYKISADRMRCVDCGTQVFLPARQEIASHFEDRYAGIKVDYDVRI